MYLMKLERAECAAIFTIVMRKEILKSISILENELKWWLWGLC